jgi:hypothetical protein
MRKRPELVAFAAIMSFIVGVFNLLSGISELANSAWLIPTYTATYSLFNAHFLWWAIFDLAIGLIALTAGISILRGGMVGFYLGLAGAAFGVIRWLFYIPAQPWLCLTIIVLDVLVIYSLVREQAFFTGT